MSQRCIFVCVLVACPALDDPVNGVVAIATNGSVTTAAFECYPDFSLIGNRNATCTRGLWNESPAYCGICNI